MCLFEEGVKFLNFETFKVVICCFQVLRIWIVFWKAIGTEVKMK